MHDNIATEIDYDDIDRVYGIQYPMPNPAQEQTRADHANGDPAHIDYMSYINYLNVNDGKEDIDDYRNLYRSNSDEYAHPDPMYDLRPTNRELYTLVTSLSRYIGEMRIELDRLGAIEKRVISIEGLLGV